jgi:hypothetical protein
MFPSQTLYAGRAQCGVQHKACGTAAALFRYRTRRTNRLPAEDTSPSASCASRGFLPINPRINSETSFVFGRGTSTKAEQYSLQRGREIPFYRKEPFPAGASPRRLPRPLAAGWPLPRGRTRGGSSGGCSPQTWPASRPSRGPQCPARQGAGFRGLKSAALSLRAGRSALV